MSTLEPASEVTRSVATLWWTMAVGTGLVLLLMGGLAGLALRQNPPRSPSAKGVKWMLVAGGLALPSVVIAALLVWGIRLEQAQWPGITQAESAQAFHVEVIAHQWWWEVRYPGLDSDPGPDLERLSPVRSAPPALIPEHEQGPGGEQGQAYRTVNVLHVPAGVPVHLRIMSADVIHGFWVPRIAGKLDAVPGRVNRLRLWVDEPGEYAGVCAEYCGEGHAHMPFTLVAHPADDREGLLAAIRKEVR